MKINPWTFGLAAVGVVSLASAVQAEEKASPVMTALSATTLSGYVNTSMIWKPGTSTAAIPGRAFDGPAAKQDGFNLDVVSLTLAKPISEGDWGAGYLVQMWLGPDMAGFNPDPAGVSVIKQAYVILHAPVGNGLDFKLGHFNYIGGYEYPDATDNPNYSRSYAWALEPASHTGLLASYKVSDCLSLAAGVANTFNNGINWRAVRSTGPAAESDKTYMAQLALTAPESWGSFKGSTLSATVVNGLNNASGAAGSVPTAGRISCFQVGGTIPLPVKGLSLGASYDYMDSPNLPGAAVQNKSAYANAVTLYSMYQATEKLKFNARAEYTSATHGFWYATPPTFGTAPNEEMMGLTGTLDYSLWANVMSRLELRWDHSLNSDRPFGGSPAAAGGQKNAVTVALNIIYKF